MGRSSRADGALWGLVLGLALLLGGSASADEPCVSKTTDSMPPVEVGKALPTFGGWTTAGDKLVTWEDLLSPPGPAHRPDVVVISFWQTQCGPCQPTLPLLQKVVDRSVRAWRVEAILVASQDEKKGRKIEEHLAGLGVQLVSIEDEAGWVSDKLGVKTIPRTIVVDGQGIVRTIFHRECETDFEAKLEEAIRNAAAAVGK